MQVPKACRKAVERGAPERSPVRHVRCSWSIRRARKQCLRSPVRCQTAAIDGSSALRSSTLTSANANAVGSRAGPQGGRSSRCPPGWRGGQHFLRAVQRHPTPTGSIRSRETLTSALNGATTPPRRGCYYQRPSWPSCGRYDRSASWQRYTHARSTRWLGSSAAGRGPSRQPERQSTKKHQSWSASPQTIGLAWLYRSGNLSAARD